MDDKKSTTSSDTFNDYSTSSQSASLSTSRDDISSVISSSHYHYSYCGPVYTGPDGMRHHKKTRLDSAYTGFSKAQPIGSLNTGHVTHDTPINGFPRRRTERVGGIGWGITKTGAFDTNLLKSGNQIQRKYFRDQKENGLSRGLFI